MARSARKQSSKGSGKAGSSSSKSKASSKAKVKAKAQAADDGPGPIARVAGATAASARAVGSTAALAWRHASTTVFLFALVAALVGWVLGRPALERFAAQQRGGPVEVVVDPDSLPWKPETLAALGLDPVGLVHRAAIGTVEPSPFDRDSLDQASRVLLATGWFTEPPIVRRSPGGTVEIAGEWRTPKAVVERRGDAYLVDAAGSLMMMQRHWQPSDRLIRVFEPELAAPRDAEARVAWGAEWPGGSVRAAIDLAEFLAEHDRNARPDEPLILERVVGVDVSGWSNTPAGELRLRTEGGNTIVWGAPLGESAPAEAPVKVKLQQLREVLARGPAYDALGGEIAVHMPVVLIGSPIGADEASGG